MECFICAHRIGKGNHLPNFEERVEKLISVTKKVEHSSTIISDILSRILNETVMNQETICRICFNLINDIDYHLKEAQEKTDEITNKFLDKSKDPLSYRPHPIVSADVQASPSSSSSSKSKKSKKKKARVVEPEPKDDNLVLTEDEMSVNIIDKSKAKLFSHILKPKTLNHTDSKRAASMVTTESSESDVETEDKRKKLAKRSSRDRGNKSTNVSPIPEKRKKVKSAEFVSTTDDEEDEENISSRKERQQPQPEVAKKSKKGELQTVNMDELGDLFATSKKSSFYAVKSTPKGVSTSGPVEIATNKVPTNDTVCQVCQKKFKKPLNLQLHLEKVHNFVSVPEFDPQQIPETHRCDHQSCTREFTSLESLMKHKEEHEKEPPQKVDVKPVKKSPEQRKPVNTSNKEPRAKCDLCGQSFQRLYNLKVHMNRVHNKIRDFKCEFCSKAFATQSDLKQHMAQHGQGKTFQCDICLRTFTNRDSIIFHKKHHTQKHTHFCPICKKGFYKQSCVNRHMRTHTGARPYSCENCNKEFTQSTTLKSHMKRCQASNAPEILGQ